MAIKRILGVSHLPQGSNYGSVDSGYGLAMLNLPYPFTRGYNSNYQGYFLSINGDAIEFGSSALGSAQGWLGCCGIRTAAFAGADAVANAANLKKMILGFRLTKGNKSPGKNMACLTSTSSSITSSTSGLGNVGFLMNASGAFTYYASDRINTAIPGNPNSFYGEIVWTANGSASASVALYVDGQLMLDGVTDPYSLSNLMTTATANLLIGEGPNGSKLVSSSTRDVFFTISDLYCIVDDGTPDDPFIDRLGPIKLTRVPVLSTDANIWTPGSGQAAILNQRRDKDGSTDSTTIPNILSSDDLSSLLANLDTSVLGGDPVAIQIAASAIKTAATPGNLNLQAIYGGTALNGKVFTDLLTSASPLDRTLPLLTTLGSDPLTKANLANLKVAVAPN